MITLFETKTDLNCIQEEFILTKYFEKKQKKGLKSINGSKLQINFKFSNICFKNDSLKVNTSFLLVKNMTSRIILRSPIIQKIITLLVTNE